MGSERLVMSRMHVDARRELPWIVAGLAVVLVAVIGIVFLVDATNYDVWSSAITYLVLILVTAPILAYCAKVDRDPKLFQILMWALVIKLAMALARYYMINVLYSGGGDASIYHAGAVSFANNVRAGNLTVELGPFLQQRPDETRRIAIFTGVMYLITGPSIYSGFFIHSWFGYLGNLALVRGFRHGFPEGNQRRYTIAVMFLPSMMFWPSAIGKDGWMLMCLGLIGYGAARLLGPHTSVLGLVPLALGTGGVMWIRPHVGLIAMLSLALATFFMVVGRRDSGAAKRSGSMVVRVLALGVVTGLMLVAASQVVARFGDSGGGTLVKTLEQTQIGNSAFESAAVRSPLDIPFAVVSVLMRPFIWEAGNLNSLIAAAEGLLLLGIVVFFRDSLRRLFSSAWRRPYVAFCLIYAMAFIIAFSNIANAAILSRQRTQLLGLFLVVIAMPATKWWKPSNHPAARGAQRRIERPGGVAGGDSDEDDSDGADPVGAAVGPGELSDHPGYSDDLAPIVVGSYRGTLVPRRRSGNSGVLT